MSDTTIQLGTAQGHDNATQRESLPPREARLISVSDDIRSDAREQGRELVRVRGEVVRTRADGSVRIQTARGPVEVQVDDGQPPPRRGQRVEIDIRLPQQQTTAQAPARNEAIPVEQRHASLKTPQPPPQQVKLPEIVTVRVQPQAPQQPQSRVSTTPLDVQLAPPQSPAPQTSGTTAQTPPPLPAEGQLVRLTALPPEVTQSLVAFEPAQTVTTQVIAAALQPAQNIALPVPDAPVLHTQAPTQNIVPPLLSPLPPVAAKAIAPAVQIIQTPAPTVQAVTPISVLEVPSLPPEPVLSSVLSSAQSIAVLPPVSQPPVLPIVSASVIAPQTTAQTPQAESLTVRVDTILPPVVSVPDSFTPLPGDKPAFKPEALILQNQKAANITGVITNIIPAPAPTSASALAAATQISAPVVPPQQSLPVVSVFFPQTDTSRLFALQFPTDAVTVGTHIQFTPQSGTVSAQAALPLQGIPLPAMLAPQPHWPVMEEIAQTLARTAPQAAQAMMAMTPSAAAPAQIGPAAMFFIAALRGGDLGQWLGDKAQELLRSAGKSAALTRLTGEGQALRAADAPAQDWRALNIPMAWESDIQKIALYYRHERDDSEDDADQGLKGTRFVFDLALDAMGKVQLDGLFRPSAGSSDLGRLDVAVRTEQSFAEASRMEMRQIYARALRETGVSGELSFQDSGANWVTIQADDHNALGVSA